PPLLFFRGFRLFESTATGATKAVAASPALLPIVTAQTVALSVCARLLQSGGRRTRTWIDCRADRVRSLPPCASATTRTAARAGRRARDPIRPRIAHQGRVPRD